MKIYIQHADHVKLLNIFPTEYTGLNELSSTLIIVIPSGHTGEPSKKKISKGKETFYCH